MNTGEYRWRILLEHICDNCGDGFSSTKPSPRFCCHACFLEANDIGTKSKELWTDPAFKAKIQAARKDAGYPDKNRPEATTKRKLYAAAKNAVHRCIRGCGTIRLLGYSLAELKACLESKFQAGMSWDNYGTWEIDHRFPVSKFPPKTPVSVINALDNLQPLWKTDNRKKHANV